MKAVIHTISELETAIEKLVKKLQEDFQADAVTFDYYDEPYDQLILPVALNLNDTHRFKSSLPSMDRIAGQIVINGEPVVAEDAEHHPDTAGPFFYVEGIKSAPEYR